MLSSLSSSSSTPKPKPKPGKVSRPKSGSQKRTNPMESSGGGKSAKKKKKVERSLTLADVEKLVQELARDSYASAQHSAASWRENWKKKQYDEMQRVGIDPKGQYENPDAAADEHLHIELGGWLQDWFGKELDPGGEFPHKERKMMQDDLKWLVNQNPEEMSMWRLHTLMRFPPEERKEIVAQFVKLTSADVRAFVFGEKVSVHVREAIALQIHVWSSMRYAKTFIEALWSRLNDPCITELCDSLCGYSGRFCMLTGFLGQIIVESLLKNEADMYKK